MSKTFSRPLDLHLRRQAALSALGDVGTFEGLLPSQDTVTSEMPRPTFKIKEPKRMRLMRRDPEKTNLLKAGLAGRWETEEEKPFLPPELLDWEKVRPKEVRVWIKNALSDNRGGTPEERADFVMSTLIDCLPHVNLDIPPQQELADFRDQLKQARKRLRRLRQQSRATTWGQDRSIEDWITDLVDDLMWGVANQIGYSSEIFLNRKFVAGIKKYMVARGTIMPYGMIFASDIGKAYLFQGANSDKDSEILEVFEDDGKEEPE